MTRKIYVTLSGGLGNQLHTLAAAYCLAKMKNWKIVLLMPRVYKSIPFRKNERDVTSFNIRNSNLEIYAIYDPSEGLKKKIVRFFFRGCSSVTKRFFPNTHLRTVGLDSKTLLTQIRLQKPRFMQGHYENAYFPVGARELGFPSKLDLMTTSKDFKSLESILNLPNRRSIIGVHIRLGDFRTWNNGAFMLSKKYYLDNLRTISDRFPENQVWVFSDEPAKASEMLGDGYELLEISKNFNLTNAEELVLLSRVDAILASRSTFSWWACYWKEIQSNIWYPDRNLCLDGWTHSLDKAEPA